MPTYDQDAFLPAAVSSLLSQTLADWELVIVDDGSPGDARAALGHLLDDPRIRLLKLPENTGLGHALNQGLDATSAPYVAYLPSDDLYFRDH
ncbi:MAG: glycosyltransferase family 2 protein, partial [Actinomycetota bacterium]|nr:glycosyltransferase family 2 protein [Actinomycetota bacterium]